MLTKTNIARKVADEGITVIIANGKRGNILVGLLHQEPLPCSSLDVQSPCFGRLSLTYTASFPLPACIQRKEVDEPHEGFAKGELHIDDCAQSTCIRQGSQHPSHRGITDAV